jgi:glycolate oxidase
MDNSDPVLRVLGEIAGQDFVSNRQEEIYIYSRAPGGIRTGVFDYLVLPGAVHEICEVVRLAAREGIPIVPVGGGLSLSDLTVPVKGGIVMDMRRLDSIVEVNERSRYAVIEAGVTIGRLVGYLNKNHPRVRISVPDAPPSATMCGNALIYGTGHLSRYGAHSEMINGLEAVLYNGEVCRLGNCSVSPGQAGVFTHPDLTGLFVNWFGGTGIVTRLSLKLYPRHKLRDVLIFKIENPDSIPEAIQKVTATGVMEDVLIFAMKQKESNLPMTLLQLFVTADTAWEMDFKKNIFKEMFADSRNRGNSILFVDNSLFPPKFINDLMAEPKSGIEGSVDARKGGGSAYIGASFSVDNIPAAYKKGLAISEKHGFTGPLYTIRNIGAGHSVIFTFMYPFSRADGDSIETMKKASEEAAKAVQELGGVLWKASTDKQKAIMSMMDPGARDLMARIKKEMDPYGIFNPGNWDES